jgi:hypothetical protein
MSVGRLDIIADEDFQAPNQGGQADFMNDYENRYCALKGGWFSGKTWAGARKLCNLHVYNAIDDQGKPTFTKSFCVAQTYPLARTVNIPEIEAALEEMGLSFKFVPDAKRYCFVIHDLGTKNKPSEILIRSADSPETINGFTVGLGWGDEAARWPQNEYDPKKDPLVQFKARIRDPKAKILQGMFTYTPEGDDTRMYEDFEENPKPSHAVYTAGTFENPHARDYGTEMLGQLSPKLAEQYIEGTTVRLRGNTIYTSFDKTKHKNDQLSQLKYRLALQFTIDFNISPGMHGILGQYDRAKDLFTARKVFHKESMAVPQMIDELALFCKSTGWTGRQQDWPWPDVLQVFGDATGGNSSASRGENCWEVVAECLRKHRIPHIFKVDASNPFRADRINAVNAALTDARGDIHYYIHPDCQVLLRDYQKMKWDEKGEPDKRDKKMSHASEAEGYRIHYQRRISRPDPILQPLRSASAAVVGGR